MKKHTRREFLKTVGAAAASVAVSNRLEAQQSVSYSALILSERSLLSYWRMDGGLRDAKDGADGEMKGGEAVYVAGPIGDRALSLDKGRFATMGAAPHLDTDETTVELFFQITAPHPGGYNPCIIAKRASSPLTRFSAHYTAGLEHLAVWNGGTVTQITPPGGTLRLGEWHHLAVTSRPDRLQVFLDGVECDLQSPAPFNRDQKGHPLNIGSSSPQGEEAAACAVAEVAIYGAALSAADIARHVDAAGWSERRRKLAQEKTRKEEARLRERREKLRKRMNDPRLLAQGARRVYREERLTGISFGLGGIGAGTIQMNGRAERAIWQIFNNFPAVSLPNSFFAVRAQAKGGAPVVRALQTSKVGPFPAIKELTFQGEYPFAWYEFEDSELPVKVRMEAFSPLVPLNAKDSAIPCVLFDITVQNPTGGEVEVSLLAAQQNAVGCTGEGPILDRRYRGYGGNRNRILQEEGAAILHMTADMDKKTPGYGDMALVAVDNNAAGTSSWPNLKALLDDLTPWPPSLTGKGESGVGPSPAGETIDGALVVPFRLKPREKRTVRFVLAWHFPNAKHGGDIAEWHHEGNAYAQWWSDALDVARYLLRKGKELTAETRLYHDTFYKSNLPRWLLDRITSQVAVLRSKTCFWAGDGYFGAWEGCSPNKGCCAGSCTHVWHYAQAHARLFPDIARKMREETYSYQHPDGSLPHRHPNLPPALDGQCGDILGAYREHLCSADGQWLAGIWPRVKKTMEQTIRHWDPDEDGVLAGAQWNTLDGNLGGSTTWIGSLYLSALSASEKMAELQGDSAAAQRYRRIRESGAKKQNETLWNGEYYIQIRDPQPESDYGDGCEIDQLLGEWWANQVGLDTHYPQERARSALSALLKYNFRPDFKGVVQVPRKFADDNDAGLQMIQWPKGNRPNPCILYGDEVMTGFEYAAAATMVQYGMLREGFMVALAISDRYDGRLRTGLTPGDFASWGYSGNPFGDDECGKYYARAMSVWSLLLAGQGFLYDGPAGMIGFRPVWRPENHVSFFTTAEGWGLFTQKRANGAQREKIELRRGRLRVKSLVFATNGPQKPSSVRVTAAGRPLEIRFDADGSRITLTLAQETVLEAGQALEVEIV
jgi:non-lysosomal glucosylceramidase